MVTLSEASKEALDALALQRNTSVSKTAAELIDFALDIYEDRYFSELAEDRMKEDVSNDITHEELWK